MKLEVLNPRAKLQSEPIVGLFAPRPDTLDGKRVAVMCERFPEYFNALEALLKEKYPTVTFTRLPSPSSPVIYVDPQMIKDNYDIFFEGVKTTGSARHDICAALEKLGMPGVHFTVEELLPQRLRVALTNGVPTIRIVNLDTRAVFASEGKQEKFDVIAKDTFDAALHALFDPLTEAEKNPVVPEYDYSNLVFEGETYAEVTEKFLDYFNDNDMGDGLSLIPPTPEAVKWMLTGTTMDPQEVVGIMVPRDGICTVEKIAINAVMAGAKPEYLPVIIAAIRALTDNKGFDFYHIQTGTLNSKIVMWVNGPIAKEIGMNCRNNFLGPENRANSSIGRAVGLCMINLGWNFMKDEVGMLGQPGRYVNLIFAENEEDSPWESFSVQQGYKPEDSTITVDECIFTERRGVGGGMFCSPIEKDLQSLAGMVRGYLPALAPMHTHGGMTFNWVPEDLINCQYCTIVLFPAIAHELAEAGYTKEKLAEFLAQQHRTPFDPFSDEQKAKILETAKKGVIPFLSVEDCVPGGTVPTWNPKHIVILVAGGDCGQTMGIYGGGGSAAREDNRDEPIHDFQMKRITGAALTKAGR